MGLAAFRKQRHADDALAVEAPGNAALFVRESEAAMTRVRSGNPGQGQVMANSGKTTDPLDALTMARFLRRDLLPEGRMRSQAESPRSSLIGTRGKFVKRRPALKNKLRTILNAKGLVSKPETFSAEKGREQIRGVPWEPSERFEVARRVTAMRHLNAASTQRDEERKRPGEPLPGHENLTRVQGISETGATIFLTAIGPLADFTDETALASYVGIVPRGDQSHQTLHSGRITKRGHQLARTPRVQSTLVASRSSPYLRAVYEQGKARRGSGKAIIATARKLLGMIDNTLKHNGVFEDFTTFKLATSSSAGLA